MWCAFSGPPNIVRIHGEGEAVFRDDPRWGELIACSVTPTGRRRGRSSWSTPAGSRMSAGTPSP